MAEFSLHLNEDQVQIQKWVHGFAEDVMRPAAHEWDEREEFPYEIVEQAAEIGLYGWEFMINAMADQTGLTLPVAVEELFWGDAGLGMAIMGSSLAAAGIAGVGTPEQMMEWVPAVLRHRRQGSARRLLRERTRRRLRRLVVAHPCGLRRSQRRVGDQRHQGVDHERRHRRRARRRRRRRPELRGRGQASFVVPPGTKGLSQGQKYKKHGIRASHTAEVVLDDVRVPGACLLGGKERLDAKLARAREIGSSGEKQPAMSTFEATRPTVGAQALGIARAAYEFSLDYAKQRQAFGRPIIMNQAIAFKLAKMITEIDAARLLIWRAAWLAKNGGFKNAEGSMSKWKAVRGRSPGDRGSDPDPRRLRLHPRVPSRALAP